MDATKAPKTPALRPLPFAARVGSRLALRRRDHRWTQVALAARTGISSMRLSRIENGHVPPTLLEAVRLAEAFGTTLDDLVVGESSGRETPFSPHLQPIEQLATEEEFRVFSRLLDALAVGLRIRREETR
jgi:transcriptional regulator with XRE-family HTH domain